jgi:ribonuclease HI
MFVEKRVQIFTDGSCHTQRCIGAWAAIVIYEEETQTLGALERDTTHQRMELLAVIEALRYTKLRWPDVVQVDLVSDSQYVIGLMRRQLQLEANDFVTKAGKSLNNADLLKLFYELIKSFDVKFIKIKAHQNGAGFEVQNNNIVDRLCRQMVRAAL